MAIVAFGGLKGGSGKSTLACNVALALAAEGRRVVVVDADEQATASMWLLEVAGVEVVADAIERRDEIKPWVARMLARVARADVVVLDLPPHLREQAAAGLAVADLVVLPVRASHPDLLALRQAVAMLREARERRASQSPAALLVPSCIDSRRATDREIGAALAPIGEPVGPTIGSRSAFVDSFGTWAGAYAKGSRAHEELSALVAEIKARIEL